MLHRRPSWVCRVAGVLASLALGAAPALGMLRGPLDILSLPADVDAAFCISDAAAASREPSGQATRRMTEELAGHLGLPAAWDELWRTLDLPADRAIDRLLGRRVLVAFRWQDGSPDPEWVVLSLIDGETERRIRTRLRPAPRAIHAGQAILALEDGRFVLTTRVWERPAADGSPQARGDGRRALIMLAPASNLGLFNDMLPRLSARGGASSLGDDPALRRMERLLASDVAVFARGSGRGEASVLGASWRRAEALEQRGPGLDARLARLDPTLSRGDDAPSPGIAGGRIDLLAEGALLTVAETLAEGGSMTPDAGPGRIGIAVPRAPDLASIARAITMMLDLPGDRADEAIGGRAVLRIDGSGRRHEPLGLTMAVASPSLGALAPAADRMMAAMLASPAADTPGPDFRGCYPPAVRTAEIPEQSRARLGGLIGERPAIAWQYAPMRGARPVSEDAPWSMPGWWICRLDDLGASESGASRHAAELRRVSRLLTDEDSAGSVLTAGVVRPAGLLGAIASMGVPMPPAMGSLRWIDRIRWEGVLAEPGRMVIDVSIDLNPSMGVTPP